MSREHEYADATDRQRSTLRPATETAPSRGHGPDIPWPSMPTVAPPPVLGSQQLLGLQRTAGNQAVQRLLAQRGGTEPGTAPLPVQRKLAWQNTQWGDTGYLDASKGGGGGVLFVGEANREIVVKPGEDMAAEGALAAMLITEVAATGNGVAVAPGFRVVGATEAAQMETALNRPALLAQAGSRTADVGDKQFLSDRARTLVGRLGQPGVVVQDLGVGKGFGDALADVAKHTKKTAFGGRKFRKESPLRVFKDPRSIRALGMVTAVDLFTGNRDRLFMYNAENFMVTPYALTMIDNIWMGTEASYLRTTQVEGRGGRQFTVTADEGLAKWKSDDRVKKFAQGDYNQLVTDAWNSIIQSAASHTRGTDSAAFAGVMAGYKSRFSKTFAQGLGAGKAQLLVSLDGLLADDSRLRQIVPGVDLSEMLRTIRRRRDFLAGRTT